MIGKVHRLGLSGRAKSPSSSSPRPRKARSSGMMRVPRSSMRGNTALAYDYEAEPEPELIEIPLEQRKTLLQLTEKTCRWPIGDPGSAEFFFCGGENVNEAPYCAYHCARRLPAHDRPAARQAPVPRLAMMPKAVPDLIRDRYRFSEAIMRIQNAQFARPKRSSSA